MGTVNKGLKPFNEMSQAASANGGPKKYITHIYNKGFLTGSLITAGVFALAIGITILVRSVIENDEQEQKIKVFGESNKITVEKDEKIQITGITDSKEMIIKKDENEYLVDENEFDKIIKNSKKKG